MPSSRLSAGLGPSLFCLAAALSATYPLLQSGFHLGYDNELHIVRLATFEGCWQEGALRCLWAPKFAHGLGTPLFQFYQPLPYVVAMPFRWLGASYTQAIDYTGVLSSFLLCLGAFRLGVLAAGPLAGPFAALAALWVSYHQWTLAVRGGLNEALGQMAITWVLWAWLRVVRASPLRPRDLVRLALLLAVTLLAHPIVAVGWVFMFSCWHLLTLPMWWRRAGGLLLAGVLALAVSCFAWLPMLFEKPNTQIVANMSEGYYHYGVHFVQPLKAQWLPSRAAWPPRPGVLPHFALLLGLGLLLRRRGWQAGERLLWGAACAALGVAVFMTQVASVPVWEALFPLLRFLQFPWRFASHYLPFAALVVGVSFAVALRRFRRAKRVAWSLAWLVGAALAYGYAPSTTLHRYEADSRALDTLSEATFWEAHRHGAADYLWRDTELKAFAEYSTRGGYEALAVVVEGAGARVTEMREFTQRAQLRLDTPAPVTTLRFSTVAHPGWQLRVDGGPWREASALPGDALARIGLRVEGAGQHRVEARYAGRWWHQVAALVSGVTCAVLLLLAVYRRRRLFPWLRRRHRALPKPV